MRTLKQLIENARRCSKTVVGLDELEQIAQTVNYVDGLIDNPPIQTFYIPLFYSMYKTVKVEAVTLEDATEMALDYNFKVSTGIYVDDSIHVDNDIIPELNKHIENIDDMIENQNG